MRVTPSPPRSLAHLSSVERRALYNALLQNDPAYEGVVFIAVKTTGIFCRPGCTARKPKFENCDYFPSAQEALLAGFRPCKRCRPLNLPGEPSLMVKTLIDAIEAAPEKRWTAADFRALGVDSSTVRRQFKQRFGMTFVAYARSRRMGLALQQIRGGGSVTRTQIDAGYASGSGFRDAFSRILGAPPRHYGGLVYHSEWIDTPLGPMFAVASNTALRLLEFADRRGLEREIERLRLRAKAAMIAGGNPILEQLGHELRRYFAGKSTTFDTPLDPLGTDFQHRVWRELQRIPSGSVRSYGQQAGAIGMPAAVRAVARANGANPIAIVVPCHRVIGADGNLTGYAGGLPRKQWLLDHERAMLDRAPSVAQR